MSSDECDSEKCLTLFFDQCCALDERRCTCFVTKKYQIIVPLSKDKTYADVNGFVDHRYHKAAHLEN